MNKQGVKVAGSTVASSDPLFSFSLSVREISVSHINKRPLYPFERYKLNTDTATVNHFLFQLASLLQAGVPIRDALITQHNSTANLGLQTSLLTLMATLDQGNSVHCGLKESALNLEPLALCLVEIGESTGNIVQSLFLAHHYRQGKDELSKTIKRATYYPAIVFITMIVSCYLLLIFVIPKFEALFATFDADLPIFTQSVLSISHWLIDKGLWFITSIVSSGLLLKWMTANFDTARHYCDVLALKIPILGRLIQNTAVIRFTRSLSITTQAGINILVGLHLSLPLLGNSRLEREVQLPIAKVEQGWTLYQSFQSISWMSADALQMIKVGEESGQLSAMLKHLYQYQESQLSAQVDVLTKLIEPSLIIALTLTVGSLVIAMYLPIFNLMSILG
ncbi:type II secretion system F family protein [Vibrio sonorensis]|uniref:type II secretion system F family protein n=1 Tax=Vibrio sonorensis TaxID=1004316 RepID=UPI0008DAFB9F|nr:type II secretion system F family protein [Vibrio sonorensis]